MNNHVVNARAGDQPPWTGGDGRLAELVAARICHDLVSPVGAVGNGLDLLRELGGGEAEDMNMVAESATRAAAVLKLLRLAFGPQAPDGEPRDRHVLASLLEPALSARRVELTATGTDGPHLPPPVARLAALMLLAARALIGVEGRLVLEFAPGDALPLSVTARGDQTGWRPELEALVLERAEPRIARQVEFALLPVAARAAGARIETTAGPEQAGLTAVAA